MEGSHSWTGHSDALSTSLLDCGGGGTKWGFRKGTEANALQFKNGPVRHSSHVWLRGLTGEGEILVEVGASSMKCLNPSRCVFLASLACSIVGFETSSPAVVGGFTG